MRLYWVILYCSGKERGAHNPILEGGNVTSECVGVYHVQTHPQPACHAFAVLQVHLLNTWRHTLSHLWQPQTWGTQTGLWKPDSPQQPALMETHRNVPTKNAWCGQNTHMNTTVFLTLKHKKSPVVQFMHLKIFTPKILWAGPCWRGKRSKNEQVAKVFDCQHESVMNHKMLRVTSNQTQNKLAEIT